ncbi:CvpA family protein [Streptococcus didelphis]|uniref:CvpA family protein n=1 Tax=Streptococcus didelphis TaxID=102886 RepID=A0ABY9LIJ4_9STRE|nr:CvpA family protein [Streptococcus didelphis]WMB28717.1 CvpA family protein [Streptococcus didelphis]WMB29372.1 CvpA family protein [Streptococcus didelphis]
MISLILILLFLWHFYIGYHRGIILQVFYSLGALVSFLIAKQFYQNVAHKISLWVPYANPPEGANMAFFKEVSLFDLSQVFYAGIAFFAIFSLAYLAFRLLGVLVHLLPINYFNTLVYNLISGFLALTVLLVFLSMGLSILATIPLPVIQNQLQDHFLLRTLIEHCPPVTTLIRQLWVKPIV